MAQFARPSADTTFLLLGGTPTNTAGSRYTNIDESTPSDTDYVYSANNPGGSTLTEFAFSAVTDPGVSTGHIVRVRCFQIDEDSGGHPQSANTTGTATSLAWSLHQGATVIASGTINPGAAATTTYTLTAGEADAITDYSNLLIELSPGGGAGSPANRRGVAISWVELEVPDAAVNETADAITATSTGAATTASATVAASTATATSTGATLASAASIAATAASVAVTGAALDATAETAGSTNFNAGVATATFAAIASQVSLAAALGVAQGRSS